VRNVVRGIGGALACAMAVGLCTSAGVAAASTTGNQAATAKVTTAFVTLFNANDKTAAAKEALLQDASKYKAAFTMLFSSSIAKANPTIAKVTKVTYPSSAVCKSTVKVTKCASVTYDLESANTGSALLTGVSGYAVNINGHWLVSDVTFCSLAKLGGSSC
jgi:hypothetical protein